MKSSGSAGGEARGSGDGRLVRGAHAGSIHKVGAAVQNAPSCNGWTFWHMQRDGAWVPIDVLRQAEAP